MRNFGIMSGRQTPRGASAPPAAYSAETRADSNVIQLASRLPPLSAWPDSELPQGAPLFLQIDIRELAAAIFVGFVVTVAVGLPCICLFLYYSFFD